MTCAHTHIHTPALRSFLISCVASAQQRKAGHVDVKMGQERKGVSRGQEEPEASCSIDTFHCTFNGQSTQMTIFPLTSSCIWPCVFRFICPGFEISISESFASTPVEG